MAIITGLTTATVAPASDFEEVLIGRSGEIVTSGPGIHSTFGGHKIVVSGGITTFGPGVYLEFSIDANSIQIGKFGSIDASLSAEGFQGAAIDTYGRGDTILNNGRLTGEVGVIVRQGNGVVTNNGLIAGVQAGVSMLGTQSTVTNNGTISGGSTYGVATVSGSLVFNSGEISGEQSAIYVLALPSQEATDVSNAGSLTGGNGLTSLNYAQFNSSGSISVDNAALWSYGGGIFDNSGVISSTFAVRNNATGGEDANLEFYNSGVVSASGACVLHFGTRNVIVENTGKITTEELVLLDQSVRVTFDNAGEIVAADGIILSRATNPADSLISVSMRVTNTGKLTISDYHRNAFQAEGLSFHNSGDMVIQSSSINETIPGYAIHNTGDVLRFTNSGAILANGFGVADESSDGRIVNHGTLSSSVGVLTTDSASDTVIYNSGEIVGYNADYATGEGIGIWLRGGDVKVTNTGTISGEAIALGGNDVKGKVTLINRGVIASDSLIAIILENDPTASGQGHVIYNRGDILGAVVMGDGDDLYDGRGGFVSYFVNGGDGNDVLLGGEFSDSIIGGDGTNDIRGYSGDDILTGGDDADTIFGGSGDDTITSGQGDDTISGGDGEDDINGQGGFDFIKGGDGNDYIRMGNGDGQRGEGNNGDDYIAGGNQKDVLLGGADEDELIGQGGNDVLRGGTGDDVLEGGTGDDRLIGNAGTDTAIFSGDSSDYTFTENGNGTVDVADTVGTDGTDNLFGVEYVEFTDGTYLLADLV